jgi:hypothetical protein
MMRARARQLALAATGAALVAAVAGCGEGTETADSGSVGTESSSSGTSSTSPTSSTPSTSTSSDSKPNVGTGDADKGSSKLDLCESEDLSLSLGRGDAAAGTQHKPLQFTNTSNEPCVIQGFPGVSYVAGEDRHQVGPAAYRDGEKGAPVTLNKGEMAHAPLGFVQVRNYERAACEPQPIRGLRVYPPQETESMYLEYESIGCASKDIPGHQLIVRTIQKGPGGR